METIIKVSRATLLHGMRLVGKIVQPDSKTSLASGWFLMRPGTDGLQITGTDTTGEMSATIECVEVHGEKVFCVEARKLLDILPQIPDQLLTIAVSDVKMTVEYFTGTFEMGVFKEDLFPVMTEDKEAISLVVDTEIFSEGITQAIVATGSDELRPVMSSVYMDVSPGRLSLVASDAHILSLSDHDYDTTETVSAVIPARAAKIILSMLPVCGKDLALRISKRSISIESNGYNLIYRLTEGRYPNYRGVLPDNKLHVEVDRKEFLASVRRVNVFSNAETSLMTLDLQSNSLVLETKDVDYSQSSREQTPVDYKDTAIRIGLNTKKLITLLTSTDCERCELRFSDPSRAALIIPKTGNESSSVTLLIMPLIIQD